MNWNGDVVTDNMVPVVSGSAVDESRARLTSIDAEIVTTADDLWDIPLALRLRSRAVRSFLGKVAETKLTKRVKKVRRGRKE